MKDIIDNYHRNYRLSLGFSSQGAVKSFFGAKDIAPTVDLNYIALLNSRLFSLVQNLNQAVNPQIMIDNLEEFRRQNIDIPFQIMQENNILSRLNNQGRRPEQVYYSWMRGFVLSNFFLKALSLIFEVEQSQISIIGDDDLTRIESFKRTPKADFEVRLSDGSVVCIEMQTGFTGINDIKQHKVNEAKRLFTEKQIPTVAIHFDLYNGEVAFVRLDNISEDSVNWESRSQMEGQRVFSIDPKYFLWKIVDPPIKYKDIAKDSI